MPALALALQGHSKFPGLPARTTIARWISAALQRDADLTLRFVDAREGRRLNRQFRARDYATDVLTFAYSHRPVVTADIVICVPAVRHASRERGLRLRDHLAHLLVHGTLHAHGYEHDQPVAARKMERLEIGILAGLGIADPYRRVRG
jgi:probable rRNA maturation factor